MQDDFIKAVSDFIFLSNPPEHADIIFLPGSSFPEPSEHAASLYAQGYAPYILPSGQYSITLGRFRGVSTKKELYNEDYPDEWSFMHDVLQKNGVPDSAILKENRAQYTYQNALFSRAVTDKLGLNITTAIICCKNSHARRCQMYYQRVYPKAKLLVCPIKARDITRDNWHTTAHGIKVVMGEVERIGNQFPTL